MSKNSKKKSITIQDIAAECGISSSTVSRVMNNSVLVGDEVRKQVLDTARRLGYQKRTIKKQESRAILNIALFLPETRSKDINLFYDVSEFVKGINHGFGEVKANIIVRINQHDDKGFRNKKLGDIDGCIFAFTTPKPDLVRTISQRGIPLLLINRFAEQHDSVIYDSTQAMGLLVEKIVSQNLLRGRNDLKPCYIGFLPVAYINEERRLAVLHACNRFGIPFDIDRDVFTFHSLTDISTDFTRDLKKQGYNAIICFNDFVAIQIYLGGLGCGFQFPEDFSLTGYDDSPALELMNRRINTIRFDVFELGAEAGAVLAKRIIDRHSTPIHVRLDGLYVEGETV
jgi:LacI family transcriptional regulator